MSLRTIQNQRGLQVYDPRGALAPPRRAPAPPPERRGSPMDNLRSTLDTLGPAPEEEEEGGPGLFGKGLGFVINNPVTRNALVPLGLLDAPRRAIWSGINEVGDVLSDVQYMNDENEGGASIQDFWDQANPLGSITGKGDLDFGAGDVIPDTGNEWFDRAVGFAGDVAGDPLTYVAGLGFVSKAGAASGKAGRLNTLLRGFEKGVDVEDLQKIGRRGYGAVSEDVLKKMDVEGGIHLGSKRSNVQIPGSPRITAPISRARGVVSEQAQRLPGARKFSEMRSVENYEDIYARVFRGEGPLSMEEALTDFAAREQKRLTGQGFAGAWEGEIDEIAAALRKGNSAQRKAVVDAIEGEIAPNEFSTRVSDGLAEIRNQFNTAVEGMPGVRPIEFRENYAPHFRTRAAKRWLRDNPDQLDKLKQSAPEFFIDEELAASGVGMNRRLKPGSRLEVNGKWIDLDTASISDVNKKFREAGLDFDFFETDAGILLHQYAQAVGDDLGAIMGAARIADDPVFSQVARLPKVEVDGKLVNVTDAPSNVVRKSLRSGAAGPEVSDLQQAGKALGTELDPAYLKTKVNQEATDDLRATVKGQISETRAEAQVGSREARQRVEELLKPSTLTQAPRATLRSATSDLKDATKQLDELTQPAKVRAPKGGQLTLEGTTKPKRNRIPKKGQEVKLPFGQKAPAQADLLVQQTDLQARVAAAKKTLTDAEELMAREVPILDNMAAGAGKRELKKELAGTRKELRVLRETISQTEERLGTGRKPYPWRSHDISAQAANVPEEARLAAREADLEGGLGGAQVAAQGEADALAKQQAYRAEIEAGARQADQQLTGLERQLQLVDSDLAVNRQRVKAVSTDQAAAQQVLDDSKQAVATLAATAENLRASLKGAKAATELDEISDMIRVASGLVPAVKGPDDLMVATAVDMLDRAAELVQEIAPNTAKLERARLASKTNQLVTVVDVEIGNMWSLLAPELSDDIVSSQAIINSLENLRKATNQKDFWPFVDWMTNFFKTYATLTPGFHVRNAMSAAFVNSSDNITIGIQKRGALLVRDYRKAVKAGTGNEWMERQAKVVLNDKTGATVRDAFDAMFGSGVGGRARERGVADISTVGSRASEAIMSNPATRGAKVLGSNVESAVRLPVAMDSLIAGKSVQDAMTRITRLHFDYSQLSQFDQYAKRFIPFWTFMSRNLPLQVSQMWTRPRTYAIYNNFMRNVKGPSPEGEPDYFSAIGAVPLGNLTIGGMPIYIQPDLPHVRVMEDIQRLGEAAGGENPAQALSDFNPFATAPIEYMTNRDLFTGRVYDDTDFREGGWADIPAQSLGYLFGQNKTTPGGKTVTKEVWLNSMRAMFPAYDRMVRLVPGSSGDENAEKRWVESVARTAGVPGRYLTPEQQEQAIRAQGYDERDEKAMQRALAAFDK